MSMYDFMTPNPEVVHLNLSFVKSGIVMNYDFLTYERGILIFVLFLQVKTVEINYHTQIHTHVYKKGRSCYPFYSVNLERLIVYSFWDKYISTVLGYKFYVTIDVLSRSLITLRH